MSCQVPHLVAFWRVLSRSRSPIGTADRINSFASSRKGLPFWKEASVAGLKFVYVTKYLKNHGEIHGMKLVTRLVVVALRSRTEVGRHQCFEGVDGTQKCNASSSFPVWYFGVVCREAIVNRGVSSIVEFPEFCSWRRVSQLGTHRRPDWKHPRYLALTN